MMRSLHMSLETESCIYCTVHKTRDSLMTKIHDFEYSELYLWHSDSNYPGRCVLVARKHVRELFELDDASYEGFTRELRIAARAIHSVTGAGKINYAAFGDTMPHLHVHLVPKKPEGPEWGTLFLMNRKDQAVPLSSSEAARLTREITEAIGS